MARFWKTLVPEGDSNRRYEILQEIALGGMSTVYLGSRRGAVGFERVVALKRAHAARSDVDPSALLAREAQIASRLHHTNVVSVIDVEMVDGVLMLVMEYIEGASLAQLAAAGPIAPRLCARILLDAAAGLAAVHDARTDDGRPLDLVHRDVSPQNLLVGIDGTTRLADFGIALARGSTRTTSPGMRRGKPGYMAPEYLTDGIATASTDLFALAVTAWEALTGQRLFPHAVSLEDVHALHGQKVRRPSELAPAVTPLWDAFVMRALGRRPSAPRFVSAVEYARAVSAAAAGDVATHQEVTRFVERVAADSLWLRRAILRERMDGESSRECRCSEIQELETHPEVPFAKRVVPARTTMKLPRARVA